MMPPLGVKRPDPDRFDAMIASLESELDRTATAVHAAARTASAEPHRIRERRPRPARPRHRSRRSTCRRTTRRPASTTSPARSASRRRWSRRTSRRRRRSAGWRSAMPEDADAGRLPHAAKTRRRTITSKGCRSARAAACSCTHVFPSDGEYTRDGDADLRRQHVADRLRLGAVRAARDAARRRAAAADRLAGRRAQASRPTAAIAARGARPPDRSAAAVSPARRRSSAAAAARRCACASRRRPARTWSARRSSRPTSRRCSTSTSTSCARRCRPARRRATRSSRTSARSASKARSTRRRPKDSPSRRKIFVCTPTDARPRKRRARAGSSPTWRRYAFRRPATPADVDLLMEFYQFGRKEKDFDHGHRDGAGAHPGVAAVHLPHRRGAARPSSRARPIASATSTWRRACRSSCGARRPTTSCCSVASAGPAEGSGGARAAGPPDAEGSARPRRWR